MIMKNYEAQIEEMRREVEKKEIVAQILEKLNGDMEWDAMIYKDDDSEEGHHFEEPNEDNWRYIKFITYTEVIELIEKKYFK